jgi:hypothetical protein
VCLGCGRIRQTAGKQKANICTYGRRYVVDGKLSLLPYCVWCMPERLPVVICTETHAAGPSSQPVAICILRIIQQPPTRRPLLSVYCASSSSPQLAAPCCLYIAHHPAAPESPPVVVCILRIIQQPLTSRPLLSVYCASSSIPRLAAHCYLYIAHHPAAPDSPPVAVCILHIIQQSPTGRPLLSVYCTSSSSP